MSVNMWRRKKTSRISKGGGKTGGRINVEKRRRRKELDEMTEEEINRNIGRIMRRKRSNRGMRRMRESVGGRGES